MQLTSKQRAYLRSLAHRLKPIVHVGKEGVSDTVFESVRAGFNTRELMKVKVLEAAPKSAHDIGAAIADEVDGTAVIQVIGRTIVLYRKHPERPEILLP